MKEWGISQQTFSNMVRLGALTEKEFSNAVGNFRSVHEYFNQPREQGIIANIGIDNACNFKKNS